MKIYLLLFAMLSLPFISRAGVKDMMPADTTLHVAAPHDTLRDGSSYEKAIMIEATNDFQGVKDEYAWLRKNYPGSKTTKQALVMHDKKAFDLLSIVTADGKAMDVYFDISKSYGKM